MSYFRTKCHLQLADQSGHVSVGEKKTIFYLTFFIISPSPVFLSLYLSLSLPLSIFTPLLSTTLSLICFSIQYLFSKLLSAPIILMLEVLSLKIFHSLLSSSFLPSSFFFASFVSLIMSYIFFLSSFLPVVYDNCRAQIIFQNFEV